MTENTSTTERTSQVGSTLRALRVKAGLSISTLASRADASELLLVDVEAGMVSPSASWFRDVTAVIADEIASRAANKIASRLCLVRTPLLCRRGLHR